MPEDLGARREAAKCISFHFPQTLAAMKDRQKLEQYRGQLKGTAPEQAKITEYLSNTVSVVLEFANPPFQGEGKGRETLGTRLLVSHPVTRFCARVRGWLYIEVGALFAFSGSSPF